MDCKLSFGQIRIILTITKYYNLEFDDITFYECKSRKEFSKFCIGILKDLSELFVKSQNLDDFERNILEDYYYDMFLCSQGSESEDFPYILYIDDYNIILEIPINYKYREEKNFNLDCKLLSIAEFAQIYKLKYDWT